MGTEQRAVPTAPVVLPVKQPLTANMVKRPHTAVAMEWIHHVPAAHMESVRATAKDMMPEAMAWARTVQRATVKLDMVKPDMVKQVPDMVQGATASALTVQRATVQPDMVKQVPDMVQEATASARTVQQDMAKQDLDRLASVKRVTGKPVTEQAELAQVWQPKALAADTAQTQFTAAQPHWAQAHLMVQRHMAAMPSERS